MPLVAILRYSGYVNMSNRYWLADKDDLPDILLKDYTGWEDVSDKDFEQLEKYFRELNSQDSGTLYKLIKQEKIDIPLTVKNMLVKAKEELKKIEEKQKRRDAITRKRQETTRKNKEAKEKKRLAELAKQYNIKLVPTS